VLAAARRALILARWADVVAAAIPAGARPRQEARMKTARQLLDGKPGIVAIAPHESVFAALERMAEHDIGALVVLEGAVLVGMLSERDYARKVILLGKSSRDIRVSEIMTPRVVCVGPDHTVDQCMAVMTEKRCRHLPVIEGDRVIGVLSIGDLVKETISEQQFQIAQLESYIMT
jgi:CBS domain-containing protein